MAQPDPAVKNFRWLTGGPVSWYHVEVNKLIDLTGQVFGKLLVLRQAQVGGGRARWLCECECGNGSIVSGLNLRRGNSTSCGKCGPASVDLTGRQFFRWTVLGPAPKKHGERHWLCRCACGTERAVSSISLRRHRSKSCGCGPRTRKPQDGWY